MKAIHNKITVLMILYSTVRPNKIFSVVHGLKRTFKTDLKLKDLIDPKSNPCNFKIDFLTVALNNQLINLLQRKMKSNHQQLRLALMLNIYKVKY